MQRPIIGLQPLTIGQKCPGILSYMYIPVIFVRRQTEAYAPAGLLQPIPIPSQPFEVVSMDLFQSYPCLMD